MAKQIYDYWFVQFDFPNEDGKPYKSSGGKMVWDVKLKRHIPEGWAFKPLNTWLEIKSGFPFNSKTYKRLGYYKIITIKNVQEGELITHGCDYVDEIPEKAKEYINLQIGDRLISLTGNCGRLCVVTEERLLLNQRVGLLDCEDFLLEYTYNLLKSSTIQALINNLAGGAAQANLSPIDLCKIQCVLPPKNILREYNRISKQIRKKSITCLQENTYLAKQRDELLPILMNGQATVNYHLSYQL